MPRTRTPAAIRRLTGTRSKCRTTGIDLPPELPQPPPHLREAAKAIFVETVSLLMALGTVRKCDSNALERYAFGMALARQAHGELATASTFFVAANGAVTQHPAIRLLREWEPNLMRFETEMGMTAAARAKVSVPPLPDDDSFVRKFLRG